jgi:hypothetical protein
MSANLERVAAHRPYGLDCACGRPINSNQDWAQHFIDAVGFTEETVRLNEYAAANGEPPQDMRRLVGPWERDGGGA